MGRQTSGSSAFLFLATRGAVLLVSRAGHCRTVVASAVGSDTVELMGKRGIRYW